MIQNSRWNKCYKEVGAIEVSTYLREREKKKRMIRIAIFRLENEIREEKYQKVKKKEIYKICGWVEETWAHVMEECMRESEEKDRRKILSTLDESGRKEEIDKEIS